jgi:hypothetical protein
MPANGLITELGSLMASWSEPPGWNRFLASERLGVTISPKKETFPTPGSLGDVSLRDENALRPLRKSPTAATNCTPLTPGRIRCSPYALPWSAR